MPPNDRRQSLFHDIIKDYAKSIKNARFGIDLVENPVFVVIGAALSGASAKGGATGFVNIFGVVFMDSGLAGCARAPE